MMSLLSFNRDNILKEDPDKPRKMMSKEGDGEEEESLPSPLTDVGEQWLRFP